MNKFDTMLSELERFDFADAAKLIRKQAAEIAALKAEKAGQCGGHRPNNAGTTSASQ